MAIQFVGVRREICAMLRDAVPRVLEGFEDIRIQNVEGPYAAFRRTLRSDLHLFLFAVVPGNRDAFTFEIAWNVEPTYPLGDRSAKVLDPEGRFEEGVLTLPKGRFRIARLKGMRRDFWWEVNPPPSLADISRISSMSAQDVAR